MTFFSGKNKSQVSLFVIFCLVVQINAKQQVITEGPVSQQAKIGDSVILKCKIENLAGEPQWCIDDFCLGFSKKVSELSLNEQLTLKGRPRHKIVGDHSKGEYHLRIEPVQLQDNMYFYCMATAAVVNIKAVKSERVFLTVLTYPKSLNLANPITVSLNKPSTVQCIARQSRPPVKILIAVNGKLITDESQYSTEIIQKPARPQSEYAINSVRLDSFDKIRMEDMRSSFYDTITNLTLKDVTMKMQDQVIECFVYSFMKSKTQFIGDQSIEPTLSSFRNNVMKTKSKIQVNFAPEVNLKIVSGNKILKEEDVISLMCHTRATPEIQSYKWYVGENYLSGVEGASLNLKLRKEMHHKSVTCEATNSVASVKASIQLNILYKPSFVKGSKSFMLIDKKSCNTPLTLDCQVNANPSANITWYRRRLSKNLVQSVRKDSFNRQVDISKLIKMNINDYYYDEPIGNGPTYTIASFNCANKLNNIKNESSIKQARKKRQNDHHNIFDDLTSEHDYDDIYEDYIDSFEYEDEAYNSLDSSNDINIDFSHSGRVSKGEFDDFGIYICEASNMLSLSNLNENKQHVKRYIKVNPIGPPILRIISFPLTSSNMEKMISTVMIPAETEETNLKVSEYTSSLGDSISLTCLIEPLPEVQTVIWIKDNGKIIPNSKYSIFETITASSKPKKSSRNNFRIKYENLTSVSNEVSNGEESVYLSDSLIGRKGLKSNDDAGLMRSVLYIKNVREQDFGVYKCKSSNTYGSRTSSVLVREKTFFDKMNNQMVFTATIILVIIVFACLLLIFICLISKRIRNACCCYRITKEKELLSQNSNCEQNSDKTINEWLASSKLSNDTGTSSLINAANNTSTNTAATLLNVELHNTLTKGSKRLLINTPQQLRREIANGNCSSLLNDDLDDIEHNSSNETLEQSRRRNLGLLSEPTEFNIANSTFNKNGNNNSNANNYYQSSQFNRFLVSSPLMSTSSSQKENSIEDTSEVKNVEFINSMATPTLTKTMHMPHMMTIRSQNISNGNFNAKISSGFSNCAINEIKNTNPHNHQIHHKPQFNTFTMKPKTENSIYENSKASSTDLNKMLQDTTFRLSDLFNELSPNLMSNNNNTTSTLPHNNSSSTTRNYQGTLPKNSTGGNNMSLFQQFPTIVSASSPKHNGSRQNLLQTTLPHPSQLQTNTSFNKFPNPHSQFNTNTAGAKSTTSKFYTNFYRNPNLQINQENYNYDDNNSTATTCTNSLSNTTDTKQNSPNYSNNSPIAKIVTTSSQNGSNKYQTVV